MIMVARLVEGLRRTVGTALTVLVIFFIGIGLFGHLLPGKLAGRQMLWPDLFYYLAWDPTSILGVPMKIVQERLGHSDYTLTANTYSHLMKGAQAEAAEKVDRLFVNVPV